MKNPDQKKLRELKGIGLKSETLLNEIGVFTRGDLAEFGPVKAYTELRKRNPANVNLNFLYAMVGALEDRHWTDIAKSEKARLLFELEDYQTLMQIIGEVET